MDHFPRSGRLRQVSLISKLFSEGRSFYMYPFKVFWMQVNESLPSQHQVLLSVSRRNFKRAVDRNRIRRLMREAYRQNKQLLPKLPDDTAGAIVLAIVFTGKDLPEYREVRDKIIGVLRRLSGDYEKAAG